MLATLCLSRRKFKTFNSLALYREFSVEIAADFTVNLNTVAVSFNELLKKITMKPTFKLIGKISEIYFWFRYKNFE